MGNTKETKRQARDRHRREMAEKGIVFGCRKPGSAKKTNREQYDTRIGICLVCGLKAPDCICSGRMTSSAMDRYFGIQRKEKKI